jgi:arylsulfatase
MAAGSGEGGAFYTMKVRLRLALLFALGLGLSACGGTPRERSVVLLVIDTLRADHLSLYGYARATSPALDRFAAQAAVFERAFAPSSWTLPSIGSLLTGRLPSAHGAGIRLGAPAHFARLGDGVPTLAETLGARGYATAAFVANPYLVEAFGLARGFGVYENAPVTNKRIRRAPRIFASAEKWLREHGDRPFFLLVHVFDPHMDYDPPGDVRGAFTGGIESGLSLPLRDFREMRAGGSLSAGDREFVRAAYDEEILGVDAALGAFLQSLADAGLLDSALVVLTSDHGEELFEHGGFEHGHSLHQELLHVPLLVWGPGVAASRVTAPVSLVDVLPTIAEATGMPVPPDGAGVSLWPLLRERGGELAPRALWAESTLYGPPQAAIVRWPHKLVIGDGSARLFDLERDPAEQRDLASAQPERAAALEAELRARLERARQAQAPREPARLDDGTRERLRALGYLDR